jgi:hypothetical protein
VLPLLLLLLLQWHWPTPAESSLTSHFSNSHGGAAGDGRRAGIGKGASVISSSMLQHNGLFLRFPYVCPEPVLVKSSFVYING